VNHTRFPKEDHLPDWDRRDNKFTKGDRVEYHHFVGKTEENRNLEHIDLDCRIILKKSYIKIVREEGEGLPTKAMQQDAVNKVIKLYVPW